MKRSIWVLAVLLSHWRRHPMQLATLLIGLISATALWSGVQALNLQARESYGRINDLLNAVPAAEGFMPLPGFAVSAQGAVAQIEGTLMADLVGLPAVWPPVEPSVPAS